MARSSGLSQLLTEYWQSQARIALDVTQQAQRSYANINPLAIENTGSQWVAAILTLIRIARRRSIRNAIAFYRLYRAIETGRTFALTDQIANEITLRHLREEWARESGSLTVHFADDDVRIPVEPFQWPTLNDELLDRQAAVSLAGTGPARVQQLVTDYKGRLDDPNFLAALESASRGAATVAGREAIRSGRNLVDQASKKDSAVLGWARVTDGNPCHFCAMLAARGAVYKSRQRAELGGRKKPEGSPDARKPQNRRPPVGIDDLKKYHPGCHCQVVPVYRQEDFLTPEARSLDEQWRKVTAGKSGANARAAWRKHIEAQQRANSQNTTERLLQSAQEATGNV